MKKPKRRGAIRVRQIRERIIRSARLVIKANGWNYEALTFEIGRLYSYLVLLAQIDPHFDEFIEKYSARVCEAPDCRKVYGMPWGTTNWRQRYHNKSCRSRHNMQKRRGKVPPDRGIQR